MVFLPCAQSPLKRVKPLAQDRLRLQLLRRGLRGVKWAEISTWELLRGGISYSVDTARRWSEKYPKDRLFWILGSDQWKTISQWRSPRELAQQVHFLVFPRPDLPRRRQGFVMSVIPKRYDISATEIRLRLKSKLPITGLVCPAVERILYLKKAYR